jgi:excisionase family DNA binding protein
LGYSAQGFGVQRAGLLWHYTDIPPMTDENEFMTADEAAVVLKLHPRTVRRMLALGRLPGARVGLRQWRVSKKALRDLIERRDIEKPRQDH